MYTVHRLPQMQLIIDRSGTAAQNHHDGGAHLCGFPPQDLKLKQFLHTSQAGWLGADCARGICDGNGKPRAI